MSLSQLCRYIRLHTKTCIIIIAVEILIALVIFYKVIPLQSSPQDAYLDDPFGFSKRNISEFHHRLVPRERKRPLDLHLEDGRVLDSHHDGLIGAGKREGTGIAIGLAITSKGIGPVTADRVRYTFPFLRQLLPSLCKTSTEGYQYHLYVAYDADDPFFSDDTKLEWFVQAFYDVQTEICSFVTGLWLHLIRCSHAHKPAWAQNDAMYEAYLDHMDYYYRINDDIAMKTPGWTERFISALENYQPPNIGVVGPKQVGGKINILTFDFVHRSHIDIFGVYYPRSFTDWWADDWITTVYQPGRSSKILDSKVLHTQQFGTRYNNQFGRVQFLPAEVEHGKNMLKQFISHFYNVSATNQTNSMQVKSDVKITPKVKVKSEKVKVIAMSLWGNNINCTHGAIRNVNLAKLFFPQWTVRIYVENSTKDTVYEPVPQRILQKLQYLGAELYLVSAKDARAINPPLWHYLVADDTDIERFVIRNTNSRLSARDFTTVERWEQSHTAIHCIRDHPRHASLEMVDGLWGAKPLEVHKALNRSMRQELIDYLNAVALGRYHHSSQDLVQVFLTKVLWGKLRGSILCHDSVACKHWSGAVKFPGKRKGYEYVGQIYDAWGNGEEVGNKTELYRVSDCEGNAELRR